MEIINNFVKISETAVCRVSALNLIFVEAVYDTDSPGTKIVGYKVLAEGFHKPTKDSPNVFWCLGKYKTEKEALKAMITLIKWEGFKQNEK